MPSGITGKSLPQQPADVVADDVQLAVIAPVEEVPAPALLAAERVVPVQRKEHARPDAAGADEGAVAGSGRSQG